MEDIVGLAVKYTVKTIEGVGKIVADDKKKDALSKLRSRIRSMPSLLLQAGLRPALAFYLSKTEPDIVEALHSFLGNGDLGVRREKYGADKAAYAAAAALLLKGLEAYSPSVSVCGDIKGKLRECFEKLEELEPGIEAYAVEYMAEAKKISDALIKESDE